jgi:putative addiction module component (TIGR02574 family)
MTKETVIAEALKLDMAERVAVSEAIADSIAQEQNWGLSGEQEAELMRRLEAYKRNPQNVLTQQEVDEYLDREFG